MEMKEGTSQLWPRLDMKQTCITITWKAPDDPVTEMKGKCVEGNVAEEIYPKCGKKFACYLRKSLKG